MFENDYISRQIEIVARSLAMIFLGKDLPVNSMSLNAEVPEVIISDDDLFCFTLKKYIKDGEINKAEDTLFDRIKLNKSSTNMNIAIAFYSDLNQLDEHTLNKHNFSKQEIVEGLEDVKKLYLE